MYRKSLLVTALAATAALGGCAPSGRGAEGVHEAAPQQTFGPEERRIARALSIGKAPEQENASPRFSAMLCSLALEAINAKLEDSDLLSPAQSNAFAQARQIYSQRAVAGLTASEKEKIRKDVETSYPDEAERARLGLGCLRSLAMP